MRIKVAINFACATRLNCNPYLNRTTHFFKYNNHSGWIKTIAQFDDNGNLKKKQCN